MVKSYLFVLAISPLYIFILIVTGNMSMRKLLGSLLQALPMLSGPKMILRRASHEILALDELLRPQMRRFYVGISRRANYSAVGGKEIARHKLPR